MCYYHPKIYFEHMLYIQHIVTALGPNICSSVYIKYVRSPWFEQLESLYFVYYAWAGFSGVEAWEDKLLVYYCSHAIQKTWYLYIVHMQLVSILCSFLSNSTSTCMQLSSFQLSCTTDTHGLRCMYFIT